MAQAHWTDTVIQMATADLANAKAAIRGQLFRPVGHQRPIRQQMTDAMAMGATPDARVNLARQLYAKYGDQAINVAPYLGIDQGQYSLPTTPTPLPQSPAVPPGTPGPGGY